MYHKYTLTYQKYKKKNVKNRYYRHAQNALHFALNIGGISAQSHMLLLFVICFSR
jgi:hypothetical protein